MVPLGEPETTIPLPTGNIYTLNSTWGTDVFLTSSTNPIVYKTTVDGTQSTHVNFDRREFRSVGNRKARRTEAAKARKKKKNVKSRSIRK